MNKKKTTSSSNQNTAFSNTSTSQVGDSADIRAFRDWSPQADPSIPYRYARARTDLNQSFNNPLGQYTTPAIREATQRAGEGVLRQEEGQSMREGAFDVNAQTGVQRAALAELTAPRTVSSSGTGTSSGTGSSVYSPSPLDTIGQVVGIGQGAGLA